MYLFTAVIKLLPLGKPTSMAWEQQTSSIIVAKQLVFRSMVLGMGFSCFSTSTTIVWWETPNLLGVIALKPVGGRTERKVSHYNEGVVRTPCKSQRWMGGWLTNTTYLHTFYTEVATTRSHIPMRLWESQRFPATPTVQEGNLLVWGLSLL